MTDRTNASHDPATTAHSPAWWSDQHSSNWDRVKGAMRRDWKQTKSDFSKGRSANLNQSVADTVKQSVGSAPIPPIAVKTRPTDPKVAAMEVDKAWENMEKEFAKTDMAKERLSFSERTTEAQTELTARQAEIGEEKAEAQEKARDKMSAARVEAPAKWHAAEQELRYGYAARSQYPAERTWDTALEGTLRGEWDTLETGKSWDASRDGVRRGWEFAEKGP
jgi:hypothetical protein